MRLLLESLEVNRHHEGNSLFPYDAVDATSLVDNKATDDRTAEQVAVSDEALMAAYANGNVQAFEVLYKRHKDPLLRYFLRQVGNRATAEELFQEAWQSLIKNAQSYKSSAKFTTYLYTIAHSRLVDHYRKSGRADYFSYSDENEMYDPVAGEEIQPERLLDIFELQQQLIQSLDALAPAQKEVFILKFEAGMSIPEIAESLGLNPEAAKSRLRYAIANLQGFFTSDQLKG